MYTVTGATGQLGRLAIEQILAAGVAASQVVAVVRDPGRARDLADRGIDVRQADYDRPETLREAFAGTTRLLFVSGSEVGRRVPQHLAVIDAALGAGAQHIAYTSILRAESSALGLADEHRRTEELLREADVPITLLRNSWYTENYTAQIPTYLEQGRIVGAAGDGLISAAPRADYAAAAAAVLTTEGHGGAVYELGGDAPFTMTDLAQVVSRVTGREVVYQDLPVPQYAEVLTAAGLPPDVARSYAEADAGIAQGELHVTTGDLSRLIGRPTTSLEDAVARAVEQQSRRGG